VKLPDRILNNSGNLAVALRITIIYAILGTLWIAYSDYLLITIFNPDTIREYALLQTYKGWFFILLTSIILILLILGNLRKLTKSEDLRHQTENRYRAIFENTGTAIAIIDKDYTISLVNEKFCRLSGQTKLDVEGKKRWIDFLDKDDLAKMVEYHRLQKKNNYSTNEEFRFIDTHSKTHHVLVTITAISRTNQSIISILDITEMKDLESKYLRAQRMESIGTLSGGLAHDLNNILSPVVLSIESLQNSVRTEKEMRLLNIAEKSARRGIDLVNQMLTFTRGELREQIILQPRYVIKEVMQIISASFPKSIHINANIQKNLWTISGNVTQIHQAMLNICINARDAMPEGGELTVTAENCTIRYDNEQKHPGIKRGSYVVITITDTGCGIQDGIKAKLFSPFFSTKDEGKGTGLGLPTVNHILTSHNGFVNFDSTYGHGSTFRLYFPALKSKRELSDDQLKTFPSGNGQLLLIIDDEATVSEMLQEILKSYNYEVLTARDGAEGLAKYMKYKDKIDLVLTDSNMPFLEGDKLIQSLTNVNPDVKIFLTSGSYPANRDLENLQPPIVGYLQKPYTTNVLLTQIKDILNT
jgi:two-component system, cell cycle sensor histidine kinase and response regulator CckA